MWVYMVPCDRLNYLPCTQSYQDRPWINLDPDQDEALTEDDDAMLLQIISTGGF